MLVSCVSCQYALPENAVSHRRHAFPAMSFRKEWVCSLATIVFFFVVPKDARVLLLFVGQGRPIPALSSLYGKALCFLHLITSIRDYKQSDKYQRCFFVASGILLLLFPAMITRFHFPTSCHDRRASVLKWEQ